MTVAIKQTVTVQEEGRIEIRSSQLHPGDSAEVVVLLRSPGAATDPSGLTPGERLAAFDALQRSLKLDAASAVDWARQVRAERNSGRLAGPPAAGESGDPTVPRGSRS